MRNRVVGLVRQGRVGESHPRAKLSDAQVDELRALREDRGWTLEALAQQFGITRSAVCRICRYTRRATTPERWHRLDALQASQEGV